MNTVFYAELPWPEVEASIAAGAPVFLPLGATEQHGRHMALNVDVVLPTAVAARAAAKVGGLVLPTVAYGNRSQPKTGGGPGFPGTLNLTANTFSLIVRDVICELYRQKVRKIVTVNGHYENIGPTIEGIELALDAIGRERMPAPHHADAHLDGQAGLPHPADAGKRHKALGRDQRLGPEHQGLRARGLQHLGLGALGQPGARAGQ